VDLLLSVARISGELQLAGFSWDTCVDDAIVKAGLENYFWNGWREITQPHRQQGIIDMAEKYSFPELVEKVFRHRPEMLAEFQELGFFQGYNLGFSRANMPVDYGVLIGDNGVAKVYDPANNTWAAAAGIYGK